MGCLGGDVVGSSGRRQILFHDGGGDRSQSVAALDQTLTWLAQQGYTFSFPKVR